jgi:hypothetical protein
MSILNVSFNVDLGELDLTEEQAEEAIKQVLSAPLEDSEGITYDWYENISFTLC